MTAQHGSTVAPKLFAPLGPTYDRYARLLSLGQDPRWRRFLVSRLEVGPDARVLDVATGTGAVALELVRQHGCSVVGIDRSPEMLDVARRRVATDELGTKIELHEGRAEALPFPDASFDGLTVTYLLRYVDDPAATIRELARVVRPGGTMALLEFGVPQLRLTRLLWELYVRVVLPSAGRLLSPGWHEVGRFLGPSIRDLEARLPLERQLDLWSEAGLADVQRAAIESRRGRGRLGPPHMSAEPRPAFYALARGGWRDYVTLLHVPYTLWHLSYVAIGAALAPELEGGRLLWGLAAFLLALGVGAHALDELHSRPLGTEIPRLVLVWLAAASLVAAVAIGVGAALAWTLWLLPFVAVGAFLVPAYTLELGGGLFHTDLWFGLAWGAFPVLVAYLGAAETLRPEAFLAAAIRAAGKPGPTLALDAGADGAPSGRAGDRHAQLPRRAARSRSTQRRWRARPRPLCGPSRWR